MTGSDAEADQRGHFVHDAISASGDIAYRWYIIDDSITWTGNAAAFVPSGELKALTSGASFTNLILPQDQAARNSAVSRSLATGAPYDCEFRLKLPSGDIVWLHDRGCARPVDANGSAGTENPKVIYGLLRNISRSKQANSALEHRANYDDLTGHLNKSRLREALQTTLDYNRRYAISGGYLAVGIDKLAMINDGYGHESADIVIIGVGQVIEKCLRSSDVIGRGDGDGFGCILAHCDDDGMKIAAEKILDAVRATPIDTPDGPVRVSVSIGGTSLSTLTRTANDAMTAAEGAMTQAKAQGRNCYVPYTVTDLQRSEQRENIALGDTVTAALADNRIILAYQPVIDAQTRTVRYYECLIRMLTEDGTLVPAGKFIPAIEKLGMIKPLDQRALEIAVDDLERHPDIRLAVNVSGLTVTNPAWLRTLLRLVKGRPDIAARLSVEITETVALDDFAITEQFIDAVRSLGCTVALDDFGSGYTSFKHMKSLTVDVVKIDGAFITNIDDSQENQMFVRTLLGLVDGFGLKSVAECIETKEEADTLTSEGASYLQGWYFGKPEIDPDWRR